MKKWLVSAFSLVFGLMLFAGVAGAHVVVYPNQTTAGSFEKFTVRVPNEGKSPTVKVEIKIPAEADITRFAPMPGWKYELTRDADGKITSVVWTATGEGLSETEFGEFSMQGKVKDDAKTLVWKAHQTYADGTTVDWVEGAGNESKHPASVTQVNPKPAGAAADGHGAASGADNPAQGADKADSSLPLILSIAGLACGLAALFVSLLKRPKQANH